MKTLFVLGPKYEEIDVIEEILRTINQDFMYALDVNGQRVTSANAWEFQLGDSFKSKNISWPYLSGQGLIFVECCPANVVLPKAKIIGHIHEFSPNYLKDSKEYFKSSNIGFLTTILKFEVKPIHRFIAAAAHSISDVYDGKCPDLNLQKFIHWRLINKSLTKNRSEVDCLFDIMEGMRIIISIKTKKGEYIKHPGLQPDFEEAAYILNECIMLEKNKTTTKFINYPKQPNINKSVIMIFE